MAKGRERERKKALEKGREKAHPQMRYNRGKKELQSQG
jgi:hypothetical protein